MSIILGIITWLLVPAVIIIMHIFSIGICSQARGYQLRASAWSGYGIGWLLFIIYVVTLKPLIPQTHLGFDPLRLFDPSKWFIWAALVIGIALAFGLLSVLPATQQKPSIALFTLIVSATSLIAFFSYFFITPLSIIAMFFSVGELMGVLAYIPLNKNSLSVLGMLPSAPFLEVEPTVIYATYPHLAPGRPNTPYCAYHQIYPKPFWRCSVTIRRKTSTDLDWSAFVKKGNLQTTITPSSGKIYSMSETRIEFDIPDNGKPVHTVITFTDGVNQINVHWHP